MTTKTLDTQLIQLIDNRKKWDLFNEKFLKPLVPKIDNKTCLVRNGFPREDETDSKANAFSCDRLDLSMLDVGRIQHLLMIAFAYHASMIDGESGSPTRMNAEFDRDFVKRTLYSLCKPLGESNPGCDDWFSGITFDSVRGIRESRVYVAREQLASWKVNEDEIETNTSRWFELFVPLQYYRWLVPNSVVSSWNFALDRNTVYTLNWYQYYLQRMSTYETAITQYATVVKRNEILRNKLESLSNNFIQQNASLRNEFRLEIVNRNNQQQNENTDNVLNKQISRFTRSLEKLYNDFTLSTIPIARRSYAIASRKPKSRTSGSVL